MDRRSLMAGLVGFSGVGVFAPALLPIPVALRGLSLGAASIAMTGSAVMAWDDRKYIGHRHALHRSEQIGVQERLSAQHAYQTAVQDSIAEMQLYGWVMAQPAQFRAALLTEHDLWKYVPQVIEAQAETVDDKRNVSVPMPVGLMEQPSIGQQLEDSIELDTSWFDAWEARSGIICGESGDGKSKTLTYVLGRFLQANQGKQCQVYIGDPDYGSSHGDAAPNTWLGLKLGQHIAVSTADVFRMVMHVSSIVDDRATATAKAVSGGGDKPRFDAVLLILDEAPAVMAALDKDQKEEFKVAIANILRRGLKQNVTFKLGTQSLAIGSLPLSQDILRQIETVVLWRAAQVKENFSNLGIAPKQVDAAVESISALPRQVVDRFVCCVFVGKQLQVKGIPTIGDIAVSTEPVTSTPTEEVEQSGDIYSQLIALIKSEGWNLAALNDSQRRSLTLAFEQLAGQKLSEAGTDALIEYLAKIV